MSLSSVPFLFGTFPLFLLIYYLSKPRYRVYELLLFSAWFYYVNEPERLIEIGALIIADYLVAAAISHYKKQNKTGISRLLLALGIVGNAGLLFLSKYSVSFPMAAGQSFFTFSLISYLADVYTGKCRIQKNPFKLADYVLMFPKILMGPIARYSDMESDVEHPTVAVNDVGGGAKRFMRGFCKKTIIADNLALLVAEVNADCTNATVAALWIGSIAYSLQLFFDFSGYSDMAIGAAQMLGFHIKENFNYPYCCKSFTDFWRRWHISLSEWFRDYVYIPLGGSRTSFLRNICNLLIVWILTGIWHGSGYRFIVWGLIYFAMLVCERYLIKPKQLGKVGGVIWRFFALLVINFNWVLFSHASLRAGLRYCLGMIGLSAGSVAANVTDIRLLREYGIYLVLGIIFSTPIAQKFSEKQQAGKITAYLSAVLLPAAYLLVFIWGLSFIMLGFHNPFMYQEF